MDRSQATMDRRRADWRYGNIVYQVFVDRFAPSARLAEKLEHYAPPRRLMPWDALPERGEYLAHERNSQAELDFWGGDLESFLERIPYLHELGVEVVYFNPIFHAFTNHKYDAMDYFAVDPQYGDNAMLLGCAEELHARGMRVMLDGVFNHMGRRAPMFQSALADGPERDTFVVGPHFRNGHRGWRNVQNLPELNLENPNVRGWLWKNSDSVVRRYLTAFGIDGWRLDVAPDVGFDFLRDLTEAAHEARPDSLVIGECWNFPEEWLGCLDGIMNMHARTLLIEGINGRMSPGAVMRSFQRMIDDGGEEGLLRSHVVLDNHDLPRLTYVMPERNRRELLRFLQFTIPGSPVIYYGSELGMDGGHDPTNRAPMRWDLLGDDNEELAHVRRMVALRKDNPALRIGGMRVLEADRMMAFLRLTDRARETALVLANPSDHPITEVVQIRDSRWMDAAPVVCQLTGEKAVVHCGLVEQTLGPWEYRLYRTADQGISDGYSMFKRVP